MVDGARVIRCNVSWTFYWYFANQRFFPFGQSCEQNRWIEHENTQVLQTCWAVLALMYAKYPHPEPIEKGVRLVMSRQRPVSVSEINPLMFVLNRRFQDGSWPQEAIEGIFSKTCTITYPNFRVAFPVKMLGKAHLYLAALKASLIGNSKANGSGHNNCWTKLVTSVRFFSWGHSTLCSLSLHSSCLLYTTYLSYIPLVFHIYLCLSYTTTSSLDDIRGLTILTVFRTYCSLTTSPRVAFIVVMQLLSLYLLLNNKRL